MFFLSQNWINKLFPEEHKLEKWQGPPNMNTTVWNLSFKVSLFIQFTQSWKQGRSFSPLIVSFPKIHSAPLNTRNCLAHTHRLLTYISVPSRTLNVVSRPVAMKKLTDLPILGTCVIYRTSPSFIYPLPRSFPSFPSLFSCQEAKQA